MLDRCEPCERGGIGMAAPIAEIRDRLRIMGGGVVWIPQGMTGDVLAVAGGYAQHTI